MLRIRELDILPHNRYLATDEKPSDEHRYRLTQVVHSYTDATRGGTQEHPLHARDIRN